MRAGRISLGRIELEDGRPRGRVARESIEDRWGATNPMRRAASAAAAYLEQLGVRGINAYGTWAALQGDQGCVLVGLTIGHFFDAMTQLEHGDLESWLQVLHPTRRAPLLALSIRPWGAWSDDADR